LHIFLLEKNSHILTLGVAIVGINDFALKKNHLSVALLGNNIGRCFSIYKIFITTQGARRGFITPISEVGAQKGQKDKRMGSRSHHFPMSGVPVLQCHSFFLTLS
jgi:hypothetical protein